MLEGQPLCLRHNGARWWQAGQSSSPAWGRELVPQSVACLVSMPHLGVDVIASERRPRDDWQSGACATTTIALGEAGGKWKREPRPGS